MSHYIKYTRALNQLAGMQKTENGWSEKGNGNLKTYLNYKTGTVCEQQRECENSESAKSFTAIV